jgi:hypothetical protein
MVQVVEQVRSSVQTPVPHKPKKKQKTKLRPFYWLLLCAFWQLALSQNYYPQNRMKKVKNYSSIDVISYQRDNK